MRTPPEIGICQWLKSGFPSRLLSCISYRRYIFSGKTHMPELPEVETVVRDLRAAGLGGRRIESVRVYWPRTVAGLAPAEFIRRLRGARITGLRRRGKYILM